MELNEIMDAIKIGFDKPRLYKRSVWNKAVKVMEFLSDHTNGEIVRTGAGNGFEKYASKVEVNDEQLSIWAAKYKRSLGFPIRISEAMPELNRIARNLGVKVNNGKVLIEYANN